MADSVQVSAHAFLGKQTVSAMLIAQSAVTKSHPDFAASKPTPPQNVFLRNDALRVTIK